MLESPPAPTSPASRSTSYGRLQLRLSSGAQQGRLVELSARKCSIGSAPQCTLRLRAAGIEPVHCLIDRSGEVTIIRRHAGESLLNGQRLEQAPLTAGDRLQLGPLEFEVVLDAKPVRPLQPQSPEPSPGNNDELTDQFRQVDARFEDLEQRLTELGRSLQPTTVTPPPQAEADQQRQQRRDELAGQVVETLRPRLAGEVTAQITTEVGAQVAAQLGVQLNEAVAQLSQQVTTHLQTTLPPQLHSQLHSQLSSELSAELSAQLFSQLSTQWSAESASRIDEQVGQRVAEAMAQSSAALAAQLSGELTEQLSGQVGQQVRRQVDDRLATATEQLQTELSGRITAVSDQLCEQLAGRLSGEVAERVLPDILVRMEERCGELADQVAAEVMPRVSEELTVRLSSQLEQQSDQRAAQLEARLTEQLTSEISQQVSEDLAPRLTSDVARRVAADVAPRVAAEVTAELSERLSPQLVKETTSRVAADIVPYVDREVTARTGPELVDRLTNKITEQVTAQVAPRLEAGLADWDSARASWEQRQQQIETELAEHCARLDERLESIVELEQRLKSERLEPLQTHGVASPDDRLEQLEQALAELREQHTHWIQQRQRWQDTLDDVRQELDERAEKTRQQLSRIEARWEAFEHEQRHRQADHETSTSQQISQRLAGIRAEREAFEERHHDRIGHHPGEPSRHLDDRLADIHTARGARERQSHWPEEPRVSAEASNGGSRSILPLHPPAAVDDADQLAAIAPALVATESTLTGALVDAAETTQVGKTEVETLACQPVHEEAPPEAPAEVEADSETSVEAATPDSHTEFPSKSTERESDEDESAGDQPPARRCDSAIDESLPTADSAPPAFRTEAAAGDAVGDEEDESIEAYMARLMQRVKSISPESSQASSISPAPRVEATADYQQPQRRADEASSARSAAPADEPPATPIMDLSELAPRSLPAEINSNMSAMRDLANMTARSAIDTHQRKRMSGVIYSKLTVAITALMAAVALAWMSNEKDHVAYAAALVSMVVGVVWGLQYLLLTGSRLFLSPVSGSDAPVEKEASTEE